MDLDYVMARGGNTGGLTEAGIQTAGLERMQSALCDRDTHRLNIEDRVLLLEKVEA